MQTTDERPGRVGLYIKVPTRDRLNLYKAQLLLETGTVFSQDDAINLLLDGVGAPTVQEASDERQHA